MALSFARTLSLPVPAGRSSFTRGVLALFIAPLLATPPATLLLSLTAGSPLQMDAAALDMTHELFGMAAALIRLTLMFGLPTWGLLHLLRRESALTYGAAGGLEALSAAIAVSYGFTDGVRTDQIGAIAVAGIVGTLIALLFWAIARAPGKANP